MLEAELFMSFSRAVRLISGWRAMRTEKVKAPARPTRIKMKRESCARGFEMGLALAVFGAFGMRFSLCLFKYSICGIVNIVHINWYIG